MLRKLWTWLFPQPRDYTEETMQRLSKACAECGVALHESQETVERYRAALEAIRDGIPGPRLAAVDALSRRGSGE